MASSSIDAPIVQKIRKAVSAQLGCPEATVILSCTHTHSGPHTRSRFGCSLNLEYIEKLYGWTEKGVADALTRWTETDVYFYSCKCDQNYNRRYVNGANVCKYLPQNRSLEPLGTGFTDQ